MAQKSVLKLISSFSESEFRRFIDMLNSPFHNKRGDLLRLSRYLDSVYPGINEDKISYENIYLNVYGGGKVNIQVVKNLLGRLNDLAETFLIQIGLEKDSFTSEMLLTKEFIRRNMNDKAIKKVGKIKRTAEEMEKYSVELYRKLYELNELKYEMIPGDMNKQKIEANKETFYDALRLFLTTLLRIANTYENYRFVEKEENEIELLDNITDYIDFEKLLELIKKTTPKDHVIPAIYYYSLLSKTKDTNGKYREMLKSLAFKNINEFRNMDNIEFWQNIFASYIFSRSNTLPVNIKELHEVNKEYINNNVLIRDESGYIPDASYHNIAMQAISVGDLKWAEDFINKYKNELEPAKREVTYNFLMGYYNINCKNYDRVIPYLNRIRTNDIPTNLTIRSFYIRTYYELGYYFEAESAIDAFRKFIKANKRITKETLSTYPEFLYFTAKMVKSKLSGRQLDDEIIKKIDGNDNFLNKKWILEKIKEFNYSM